MPVDVRAYEGRAVAVDLGHLASLFEAVMFVWKAYRLSRMTLAVVVMEAVEV